MKHKLLAKVAATPLAVIVFASLAAVQTSPPMGGGYTNVIPIPVDGDPHVKAIAGALFEPEGAGPFPAIISMSGCSGLDSPPIGQARRPWSTMHSRKALRR
jgi:hypothetical protein